MSVTRREPLAVRQLRLAEDAHSRAEANLEAASAWLQDASTPSESAEAHAEWLTAKLEKKKAAEALKVARRPIDEALRALGVLPAS